MAKVTRDEALEIARHKCERNNWLWTEPISVKWGLFTYTVWGGGRKGGNICIRIRKKDGVIISSNITPR